MVTSGFPRRKGLSAMRRIIGARASPSVVTRITTSTDSLDGTTESTSEFTEDVWLFEPQERLADDIMGERVNGSLGGLVVGATNIEVNDRITYGGVEYDANTVVEHPTDATDPQLTVISFERVT